MPVRSSQILSSYYFFTKTGAAVLKLQLRKIWNLKKILGIYWQNFFCIQLFFKGLYSTFYLKKKNQNLENKTDIAANTRNLWKVKLSSLTKCIAALGVQMYQVKRDITLWIQPLNLNSVLAVWYGYAAKQSIPTDRPNSKVGTISNWRSRRCTLPAQDTQS